MRAVPQGIRQPITRSNRIVICIFMCLAIAEFFSWSSVARATPQEPTSSDAPLDFARQIRPILAKNCFRCHGPDEETREADLRLDSESASQSDLGGYQAILPGEPDESALIARIISDDEYELMPPADSNLTLTPEEINLLRRWVKAGGKYETQWSFIAPTRPELPSVAESDHSDWPRNDLDFHVLAKLDRAGLGPSPEADRHTLIRRVYLDLIGLLPSPAEVDAWINDTSPDAYEKMVDRLIASPRYGERWARRWLDVARYADTNGYEKDRPRSIWPYRDWVINSINSGMPFDQFTIEQIAGDLLPNPTQQQIVATGFHRNTMLNEEGGIDPEEFRFYGLVDRVNTTGAVWLGLTMGCAQCHTHKYDPITHEEYYKMMAFYNNADEPTLTLDDATISATREPIESKAVAMESDLENHFPLPEKLNWHQTHPVEVTSPHGTEFKILDDDSILATGTPIDKDTYTITLEEDLTDVTAIRLEVLTDPSLPGSGPGRAENGNFVISELTISATPIGTDHSPENLNLERASADHSQTDFDVAKAIDDNPATGWAIATSGNIHVPRTATFAIAPESKKTGTHRLVIQLSQQHGNLHTVGKFRISIASETPDDRPDETRRAEFFAKTFKQWLQDAEAKSVRWKKLKPVRLESNAASLTLLPDDSVLAGGDRDKLDTYSVVFETELANISALRLEALPHPSHPHGGPGRAQQAPEGDFFLSDFQVLAAPAGAEDAEFQPVAISGATASFSNKNRPPSGSLDGKRDTAWSIAPRLNEAHAAVYQFAQPISIPGRVQLKVILTHEYFNSSTSLGRFRISVTEEPNPVIASGVTEDVESILIVAASERTARQNAIVKAYFLRTTPKLSHQRAEIKKIRSSGPQFPTTLVMHERNPKDQRTTRRYHRGEFTNPRESVIAGMPKSLPSLPSNVEPNRLALAKWLVSRTNPLTGRVIMNRTWQAFFGKGIVGTIEDFGVQGDIPTNQDLIDFLAVEFMDRGWNMKQMHRLIVTSATYRQSSAISKQLQETDPGNDSFARGPRFRVEAEMVRDVALVASGLIQHRLGGASVRPPNAGGITELAYSNSGDGESTGDDLYRRGLYTYWKRTVPYATLVAFDAPTSEEACARRDRSNSPLQALTLLNDVVYVEASQAMAARLMKEVDGNPEQRIRYLFKIALTRPPTDNELTTLTEYYQSELSKFDAGQGDPKTIAFSRRPAENASDETTLDDNTESDNTESDKTEAGNTHELAAWTLVCRVILNLNEMITKG